MCFKILLWEYLFLLCIILIFKKFKFCIHLIKKIFYDIPSSLIHSFSYDMQMIYMIWIMLHTPNSIFQHWLGFSQNAVVPQNKVQTDLMTRSRQIWWLSMLFFLFKWIDSNSLVLYSFENLMKIIVPLPKYINNLANNFRGFETPSPMKLSFRLPWWYI